MVPYDQPEAALVSSDTFCLSVISLANWTVQDLFSRWIFDFPFHLPGQNVTSLKDLGSL